MWRKGLAIGITAILAFAQEAPIRREGAHWVQVVTGSIAIPSDCRLKVETRGPVTLRGHSRGAGHLHNQEESSSQVRGGSSRFVECRRGVGQRRAMVRPVSPSHNGRVRRSPPRWNWAAGPTSKSASVETVGGDVQVYDIQGTVRG